MTKLKTKEVEVDGQKFVIGSLSVRQYGAMMEARQNLYGDATSAEEIKAKNLPLGDMLKMEAEFVIAPSLNNAAKQQQNGESITPWTAESILDGMDNATFRGLVNEIFRLIGIKVAEAGTDAARGPQLVAPGESQAASPTT